jgi:hypothetical protein
MHWQNQCCNGAQKMGPMKIGGLALLAVAVYCGVRLYPEIRRYVKMSRM